ncbi:NmrA family NAD(P)-binding protein [Kitasatospora purpeofusca]|uniref:NmrA family NAD(P)-binding protein n=1 Tax=Kitasatospora purpeofusca TaxID=67352 RepID=UPI00224DDBA1|nr:NmrA family NAD(P)-binding protein [Kitasatospora purpeofusca]MCX4755831.1 NmrA family NAD(P)-binding protein [Kitasatospora purpeofusca]WSR36313.1 NmrA family NAD(P)-binding protein [Kitasatospora purpeofusca]
MTTETDDTARSTVAVTGATGNQGGATARRLLSAGRPVRALVRDSSAPAAVALAEAGAELAVTGVRQVVFTGVASTTGAAFAAPGKRRTEQYLRERIGQVTVLRPVRFMTNYLGVAGVGLDGFTDGVHRHLFPPDEPLQIIAVEDIAEFAALAFEQPERFAGRTLELAGDAPTPVEAVAAIAAATGRALRYEQIGHDEAAALHPGLAEVRRQWAEGHRWRVDIEALRVLHPGLRTLGDWLAWGGATALRARFDATGNAGQAV